MRILVTGGAGFVGRKIAREFTSEGHDVAVTVHENDPNLHSCHKINVDIRDENAVVDSHTSFEPELTIHAAALADADACEQRPELARQINVGGTENIIRACEQTGSTLAFMSSSFVFSGGSDSFEEGDSRSPINVYGETKVSAENKVQNSASRSLIIRTDQPYGWSEQWQSPTMVEWVLGELSRKTTVPVFDDWWNCPIYVWDLVAAVRKLISSGCTGVYHVVGPEYINRFEWARLIAEEFGHNPERIERASFHESSLPARRPNSQLSIEKLKAETGLHPKRPKEAVPEMN